MLNITAFNLICIYTDMNVYCMYMIDLHTYIFNFIDNRIFTILLLFETIVFGLFIGAVGLGQVSDINHFTDN